MRSPAHALSKNDRQIKHFLICCSLVRFVPDSSYGPPSTVLRSLSVVLDSGGPALSVMLLTLIQSPNRRRHALPMLSITNIRARTFWSPPPYSRLSESGSNSEPSFAVTVDFANKAVGFQSTPAGIWDAAVLKGSLVIFVLR